VNYEILLTAIRERKEVEILKVGKRLLELMEFGAMPRFRPGPSKVSKIIKKARESCYSEKLLVTLFKRQSGGAYFASHSLCAGY
jgi:hypothetical protein